MTPPEVRLPESLLDGEPGNSIDIEARPEELERLFSRVRESWRAFGEAEPDWSVSTHDRYRSGNIQENLDEFKRTGERDAARFELWLRRNGIQLPPASACIDFGCGTGRVTHALASRFGKVIAVDASQPHLDIARKRVSGDVEWRLLRTLSDVERLPPADAIFCLIVLQHSPPPLMLYLAGLLFRALRPGGVAYLQVPVFRTGYSFRLREYLASPPGPEVMEMHFLPQRHVFAAAASQGCRPLEVLPDYYTGDPDAISCTFLFRKES